MLFKTEFNLGSIGTVSCLLSRLQMARTDYGLKLKKTGPTLSSSVMPAKIIETRRCGSVYLGVVVLRVCEVCYVYEGYVGSAVVLYI